MERYKLLYILGSGHCGSTLLDLLLNRHHEIMALGEIHKVKKYIDIANGNISSISPSKEDRRKWRETGDAHSLDTPFWQQIKKLYEDVSGSSFDQLDLRCIGKWSNIRSWQAKEIESWARPNEILFSCVHQVSGARILTDSSKFPHRLYLLQQSGLFDIRVIHLQRNGCAVVNSYLRKHADFRTCLRLWVAPALLAYYLRRKFARNAWLQIRYEDLANRPVETLKTVCAFLDVSFDPEMLAYRGKPYLGFGGNQMREREDAAIVLDEQWKRELSYKHRMAFNLLAGWLNRLYGY
jgi:Sulfotransferase family